MIFRSSWRTEDQCAASSRQHPCWGIVRYHDPAGDGWCAYHDPRPGQPARCSAVVVTSGQRCRIPALPGETTCHRHGRWRRGRERVRMQWRQRLENILERVRVLADANAAARVQEMLEPWAAIRAREEIDRRELPADPAPD